MALMDREDLPPEPSIDLSQFSISRQFLITSQLRQLDDVNDPELLRRIAKLHLLEKEMLINLHKGL